ncbi:hypothetical protein [Enterococcus alishanensis]
MKKTVLLSLGAVIGLGLAIYGGTNADAANLELFRLYNPNTGEHFYTESADERDWLDDQGWIPEDGGWATPTEGDIVYRLYNPNASDHHYTTDEGEYANLKAEGWTQEGKAFFSSTDKSVPVYRSYNPNAVSGAHMFTTSSIEHDWLTTDQGWTNEAVSFYAAPAIDKAALNTALTDARALNAADYDETTFAALQEAITAAAAVADNADATQLQVNAQVTALNEAVAALVPNLTDLNAAIEAAGNYDEADITADSYADLEEAVKAAEDFVKDAAGKTPAEAQEVLADLNAALAGLAANTSALNEVITEADEVSTDGYSEESIATFNEALATANAITADSSVEEVTAARTGLRAAIDGLSVDMTALSAAIEVATAFDADDITEASYAAMATALETANGYVNEPAGVTPTQVAEAITALEEAATGLVKDTTALDAQVEAYKELAPDADDYSIYSYSVADTANTAAAALDTDAATIAEITAARVALRDAMANLVSTEDLNAAITAGKAIANTNDMYTPESYNKLQLAISEGESFKYRTNNYTNEEVAAATQVITDAIDNLATNKAALNTAIATAQGLNATDYTSTTAFTDALSLAVTVAGSADSTPASVTTALTGLNTAMEALVLNKAALGELMTPADTINTGVTASAYVADSVANYATIYAAAQTANTDTNTGAPAINSLTTARMNLEAAMAQVVPVTTALETRITFAGTLAGSTADITTASNATLTEAVNAGNDLVNAPLGKLHTEVTDAVDSINAAIVGLQVNTLPTVTAIANYSVANEGGQGSYTNDSWNAMQSAHTRTTNARDAMTNATAADARVAAFIELTAARTELQATIDGLTTA